MASITNSLPSTDEDNRFLERTVNGNFTINLTKRNIIEIALIKYGYGKNQDLMFKVFHEKKCLLEGLSEYVDDISKNIPLLAVYYNGHHWATLMVCKTTRSAYYIDYYQTKLPRNQLALKGIIVYDLLMFKYMKYYDSGIIALETAVKLYNNKEQLKYNNKQNNEEIFKEILSYNPSDLIEIRKKYADCLQIMQIQKIKLNTLSNNLKKVIKQINNNNTLNFNYYNANIFLHFLETFALQDLRMEDIEPEYKKYLKNIINSEDVERVAYIRSRLLLHRNTTNIKPDIIKPDHLMKILNMNVSVNVNDFFQYVAKYVNYILGVIQGTSVYDDQIQRPHQFLENNVTKVGDDIEKDEYNKLIDNHLELFFTKAFSSPSYSNDKQTHDEEQQSIFDLIVNFAPYFDKAFNKRKEILKEMRNIQIHEFYRYSDERFATEYALTNYLRENKNSLFKCCYSRYVYPLLRDFNKILEKKKNNRDNIENMKEKICSSVETFLKIHRTKVSRRQSVQNQDNSAIFQIKDHQHEIERAFRVPANSNLQQNSDNDKIKQNVEHFFKLLLFIANEGTKDDKDADYEDKVITRRYKNLRVEQILKINTDLADLQRLKKSTQPGFEKDYMAIRKSLQQQFKTDYGIMDEDFDFIVAVTTECKDIDVDKYKSYIDHISTHIEIISKQKGEYKCSVKDIITMYHERRELSFKRGSLEEKISSLPLTKHWDVHILYGNAIPQRNINIQVNPDKFVTIIYEILNDESQRPISDDIKDIFNDCEFLDYLEKQDIFFPNLMKECLDFMLPLLARIINLPNYGISIKDVFLCNTIKKLVEEDNIKHLKPIMIKVHNKKGNQHIKTKLLEIICTRILENYNASKSIGYLDQILDNAGIANDIIGIYLGMPEDANLNGMIIQILDTLVGTSFTIACDYKNYDRSLGLLTKENISNAVAKLEHIALDLYWSVKINIARFHHKTGKSEECIQILKDLLSMTTAEEVKPFYFLSLSYMAKIQNNTNKNTEAYNNYCILYTEMVKYILGATPAVFDTVVYNDIIKHDRYKSAQTVSSKYLDILRIKSDMAYTLCKVDYINEKNCRDALKIYTEIHKIQCDILDNFHKELIKTKRQIGYVSYSVARKMNMDLNWNEALYYYVLALKYNKEVFELQKKKYWVSHPAVMLSLKNVLNTYKNIFKIQVQTEMYQEFEHFVEFNVDIINKGSKEQEIQLFSGIIKEIKNIL